MSGLKNFSHSHDDAFDSIGRSELVRLLVAYYRDVGWWVEHVGTDGKDAEFDDGVDLKIRRNADFVLVHCKCWDAKDVPQDALDSLLGRMTDEGATGGILISGGEFTRAAIEAAQRHGQVKLIDREVLHTMLGPAPRAFLPSEAPTATAHTNRWLWLAALICAIGFVFIVRAILVRTADTAVESTACAGAVWMPAGETLAMKDLLPIEFTRFHRTSGG